MKLVITNQLIGQLMVLIDYDKIINFVNICNSSKMMCYNTFKNGIDINCYFFFLSYYHLAALKIIKYQMTVLIFVNLLLYSYKIFLFFNLFI